MNRYALCAVLALVSSAPASATVVYTYTGVTSVDFGLQAGGFGTIPQLAPGAYEAAIAFERAVERPQFEIGVVYGYGEYLNGQAVGGHDGERPLAFDRTSANRFDASFVINAAYIETFPSPGGVYTRYHYQDYVSPRYFEGPGDEPTRYTFTISQQAAVPEPASWALMIVGFGLAGTAARARPRLAARRLG